MMLPNISEFIKKYVTKREKSFFENDLVNNKVKLTKEIKGKSILVIGGAGTIGSSYIKAALRYHPSELIVVDNNEKVRGRSLFYRSLTTARKPINFAAAAAH